MTVGFWIQGQARNDVGLGLGDGCFWIQGQARNDVGLRLGDGCFWIPGQARNDATEPRFCVGLFSVHELHEFTIIEEASHRFHGLHGFIRKQERGMTPGIQHHPSRIGNRYGIIRQQRLASAPADARHRDRRHHPDNRFVRSILPES